MVIISVIITTFSSSSRRVAQLSILLLINFPISWIVFSSSLFLLKKPLRVERQKGKAALGKLKLIEDLPKERCCVDNCVMVSKRQLSLSLNLVCSVNFCRPSCLKQSVVLKGAVSRYFSQNSKHYKTFLRG